MFTNSSVGVVFWNKVFSSDTVSGYKCSHFLVTMHSLLLGIFIKKTKMESFCTKTSPVQGGGWVRGRHGLGGRTQIKKNCTIILMN